MSILFVLLTFLLILSIMYFRRPEVPAVVIQPVTFQKVSVPKMIKTAGIEVPESYSFHPGHTWVHDEGHQNARVGINSFASNLFGEIDGIELADLNRWVRQGQKLCTLKRGERSVDMLSPVEGVLVSINHEVLKTPSLATEDPYKSGWLCVIKAPRAFDQYQEPVAGSDCSGVDAEQHRPPRRNDATTQPRSGARWRPPGEGHALSGR